MSDTIKLTPKSRPSCPNHGVALEGIPTPIPPKGVGVCPISKYQFAYEVDGSESSMRAVRDAQGNVRYEPTWKLIGEETKP